MQSLDFALSRFFMSNLETIRHWQTVYGSEMLIVQCVLLSKRVAYVKFIESLSTDNWYS